MPEIITGWLDNSFAPDCVCGERLLAEEKPKSVRIHIANGTCFPERGRVCGRYEVFAGHSIASAEKGVRQGGRRIMRRYADRLDSVAQMLAHSSGGSVTCYISPCLECPLSRAARRVLLALADEKFPHCTVVDNPMRGRCVRGYACERHGIGGSTADIVDTDGVEPDAPTLGRFAALNPFAQLLYAWRRCMNGIHGSRFVDPRRRTRFCTEPQFAVFNSFLKGE